MTQKAGVGTRVVAARRGAREALMRHGAVTPQVWRKCLRKDRLQISAICRKIDRSSNRPTAIPKKKPKIAPPIAGPVSHVRKPATSFPRT